MPNRRSQPKTQWGKDLRNEALIEWSQYEKYFAGHAAQVFCPHLWVASSKFKDLISGKMTSMDVHKRSYYFGAYGSGKTYEDDFATRKVFYAQGSLVKFKILSDGISQRSSQIPFVCAESDFIVSYKDATITTDQYWSQSAPGLVEIKHTTDKNLFSELIADTQNEHRYAIQLRTALEVAGLNVGFLVVYECPSIHTPPGKCEVKAKKIYAGNLFSLEKKTAITNYSSYLEQLFCTFYNKPTIDSVLSKKIRNFVSNDFAKDTTNEGPIPLGPQSNKNCKFLREITRRQGFKRSKPGRPCVREGDRKHPRKYCPKRTPKKRPGRPKKVHHPNSRANLKIGRD